MDYRAHVFQVGPFMTGPITGTGLYWISLGVDMALLTVLLHPLLTAR